VKVAYCTEVVERRVDFFYACQLREASFASNLRARFVIGFAEATTASAWRSRHPLSPQAN